MVARRIRWLSASRLRGLQAVVSARLQAWHDDWSVTPEVFAVEPAALPAIQAAGWRWYRATGRHGLVVFGARVAHLDGLGARLAAAPAGDSLGLGQRIGRRAVQALLSAWLAEPGVEIVEVDTPGGVAWRSDAGGASFRITGDAFDARLLLDAAACDHWAPPLQPTALPVLHSRAVTTGAERVSLEVILALGDSALSETQGLQVGDVLVSKTPLTTPFDLFIPGASRVATARLQARAGHRALLIDSPTLKS